MAHSTLQVLPEILQGNGRVEKTHVIVNMLKCWSDGGPTQIRNVLNSDNILAPQGSLLERTRPGLQVPPHLHDSIKWGGGMQPFQPNEVVAIQDDTQTDTAYK
jgi:hypothetical protein